MPRWSPALRPPPGSQYPNQRARSQAGEASSDPAQIRALLPALTEPCHTIVLVAVLTGMWIGESLALPWKPLGLSRGAIEVAETFSDGLFGTPKTNLKGTVN